MAPAISTQPANQTVLEGATATFTVTATGTDPLSYQWKKNGTAVATGGTSASYTTPATVLADSGSSFTVTVTNTAGSVTSSAATLTVHSNPVITSFTPTPATITAGGSATLAFVFTGGTGSINNGVGTVTSGTNVTVTPAATTTYTLTVDNGFGTTKTATAVVTVAPAPVAPTISAPSNVTLGTSYTASVTPQTGMTYTWTATNGTITAGQGTSQITFTAGASGASMSLGCVATNAAGATASGSMTMTMVMAPVASSLTASTASPLYGATVTLTPVFSGGTGSIDHGVGTVMSGTPYTTLALTSATTFTLTVTNMAGTTVTKQVVVTPQTVAVAPISPASPTVTVNTSQAFSSAVSGAVNTSLTWTATGGTINTSTGAWTAPATAGNYTITATSAADTTKSASTLVTVAPAPVTPTITAPATVTTAKAGLTASVAAQTGMTYAWTITNGTITAGATTNQITFTAGSVGTTALNCTVTNAAGASAPAGTLSMSVVAMPVATSLVASTTSPLYGATVTLTPTFSGGTGVIDHSITSSAVSGTAYATPAIMASTTYTLTVTNAAGDTATKSAVVAPQTVAVSAVTPSGLTVTVNASQAFSSTVSGAVNTGIVWTATGGTINTSTGAWTAPATAGGPFTITATSAADGTKSASTTVTVVAAPVATITAPGTVPSGATGLTASVPAQSGSSYTWTISGGIITGGSGTNQITFTAGAVGTLTLSCTVSNGATTPATATGNASVSVIAAPVINSFTATPTTVLANAAVTLSFNFTGGSGSISPAVGAVTSGTNVTVNPSSTTTYTLTVTPPVGTAVTRTVTVTVGTLPIFSVNLPTTQTVTQGTASVTFSVATSGTPAVTGYQWYFNGAPISGATTTGYTLYNVTTAMAGNYTVVATNSLGSTTSNTLALTVTLNYSVSGRVILTNGGTGVPGVTVSINTTPAITAMTDSGGNYTLPNIPNGNYTLTPSISGPSAMFFPATQSVSVSGANQTNIQFQAAIGYTVSGTVSYSGSKTGRIYLRLDGGNGGAAPGVSISSAGTFTIRGVTPGTYTLNAWMDNIGLGNDNASNPTGSAASVVVGFGNAFGANVTLADPAAISLTGTAGPAVGGAVPFNGGALVFYNPPTNGSGKELADSYVLEASTSSSFTTISNTLAFKAQRDNPCFISGLTDGQNYYFRLKGKAGATTSNPGTASGAIVIGAGTGANTISGTVSFPGTATGPLSVGLFDETNGKGYFISIPSPVSPQAFSLSGVPAGTYAFIGIVDQNHNGVIDPGDISNTGGNAPKLTVAGNMTGQTLALSNAGAITRVSTSHQLSTGSGGTYENYGLQFNVDGNAKLPVNVAIQAGSGLWDVGKPSGGNGYWYWVNLGTLRPALTDIYTLQLGYSDLTSESVTAPVTGVLDAFPTNLAPTTGTSTSTVPTFTWAAPTVVPSFPYTYSLWISPQYGGTIWQYPSKGDMPSTQFSVVYNVDNSASVPSLTTGITYMWTLSLRDANGNEAQRSVEYKP